MSTTPPVPMLHSRLPRLLLPCTATGELYEVLYNKRYVGSSQGWLITVGDDGSISAVDLDMKTVIQLPNLMTFPDILDFNGDEYLYWTPFLGSIEVESQHINNTYVKKVFLSKNPTEEGCLAIAIFGELKRLAFCRVGDKEWNVLDEPKVVDVHNYEDVAFDSEGRFYALNSHGVVVKGDLVTSSFIDIVYEPSSPHYAVRKYLVFDTKGKLMLIDRHIGYENDDSCYEHSQKTSRFEIFELDEKSGEVKRVDRLEDNGVLFLGDNQSLLCLSTIGLSNSIYFTDDDLFAHIEPEIGGRDFGVYNIKDGTIHAIRCIDEEKANHGIWPPPMWV